LSIVIGRWLTGTAGHADERIVPILPAQGVLLLFPSRARLGAPSSPDEGRVQAVMERMARRDFIRLSAADTRRRSPTAGGSVAGPWTPLGVWSLREAAAAPPQHSVA
jgi:hypothetical protein